MASIFLKDPQSTLDYKWDWAAETNGSDPDVGDWLAAGETITAAFTVTADAGLTVDSASRTDGNTSVTAWLSGGTVDARYTVTCHIVTNAGRTDERSIVVRVRNR